jgi:hypothetical protein
VEDGTSNIRNKSEALNKKSKIRNHKQITITKHQLPDTEGKPPAAEDWMPDQVWHDNILYFNHFVIPDFLFVIPAKAGIQTPLHG